MPFGAGERVVLTATDTELVATLTCPAARADELRNVVERHCCGSARRTDS
ncbi:hypothetical protein [Mobilicoccus pelagius]|nr:hypothetical protein [Mobilicoccus pelagius]